MRILLLGGPKFLGRAVIDAARAAGHEITLFNRGTTHPELYPDVERITGDRDGGLDALAGRTWDAVIDNCGYLPRIVRASAEALRDAAPRYQFVSSISVYADFREPGLTEDAAVGTLEDPTVEEITGDTYGPLKALCEDAVREVYGEAALIVRPGLIVGPHDVSDRFTYYVERADRGGRMLVPGPAERPAQIIDVRDLAEWMIRLLEEDRTGTIQATGPERPLAFSEVVRESVRAAGNDVEPVWVPGSFLVEQGVGEWMEMPLWIADESMAGLERVDVSRAIAAGLTFRSLGDTVRDTLAWVRTLPPDRERKAGLTPQREAELLAAWDARDA